MSLDASVLWRFDRSVRRLPFLAWALSLGVMKACLDQAVSRWLGLAEWSWTSYFTEPLPGFGLGAMRLGVGIALLMLALSVPFLWAGCALCLGRLRSARLPLWWVGLFVVPVLKWFLFVALVVVPDGAAGVAAPTGGDPGGGRGSGGRFQGWAAWLPESRWGSAVAAIVISALLSGVAAVIGTELLKTYGWGLFAALPFVMGFLAAVLHGARHPRVWRDSVTVALLAVALVGVGFLMFAFEGIICLLMAAPLALVQAALGGLVGHSVQDARWRRLPPTLGCLLPLLAMPPILGTETFRPGPPPLLKVTTSVRVAAAPAQVWRHVVEFAELPPPTEPLFRWGIAYPIRAEIRGRGVGAVRHCVFSTGPFVEPITVWDEPRLLAFSVTENPAPMEEWTPYDEVHPPHLDGFLVSRRGQFRLEPTPDGGTLLEGTTWYHHSLWPAAYWQVWSDQIIHAIHRRVLDHVRTLAEAGVPE
jgi:hypothetical protein